MKPKVPETKSENKIASNSSKTNGLIVETRHTKDVVWFSQKTESVLRL